MTCHYLQTSLLKENQSECYWSLLLKASDLMSCINQTLLGYLKWHFPSLPLLAVMETLCTLL